MWSSSLPYAALLIYSPRGTSDVSRRSRAVRDRVKRADASFLAKAAEHLADAAQRGGLQGFFPPEAVLVPAPRSAPLKGQALWPAAQIAQALVRVGLASEVRELLARIAPVPKAAFAPFGQRPTVEDHLRTLKVRSLLPPATRLVVVDDVVTQGRMLYACGVTLARVFPQAEVRCFSLVRTMGLVPDVDVVVPPCVGTLR